MTTIVKVAKYRDEYDHLYRLANVDYHACVSVREIARWKETATRALAESEGLQCLRATDYDREKFTNAVSALKSQLNAADARIAQLEAKRREGSTSKDGSTTTASRSTEQMARCADCANETPVDGLAKTLFQCDGLAERLDPGSEVPAGECQCGAFAYLIATADQQFAAVEIARYVRDLVADEFFADDELPNIEWLKTTLQEAGMPVSQSAEEIPSK